MNGWAGQRQRCWRNDGPELREVGLPFTAEQFFAIFTEYNRAFWPVVVL